MEKAILRTLAYADIFDYPLTSEEIFRFLIADEPSSLSSFEKTLSRMRAGKKLRTDTQGRFYFLLGRKELVSRRKKREKISQEKLKLAQKTARLLKIISTIKLIGLTGKLAMENAEKEDDIDLLVITSRNRLWLTRLLAVVGLELLGQRRRPKQREVQNKICLNIFLDESQLVLPSQERDLYSAHEVIQMKPLWDSNRTYAKFLKANQWVTKYLPHGLPPKQPAISPGEKKQLSTDNPLATILESFARRLQFWYMGRRRTTEIVTFHRALFHPESARDWVLAEYEKRLVRYGLSD